MVCFWAKVKKKMVTEEQWLYYVCWQPPHWKQAPQEKQNRRSVSAVFHLWYVSFRVTRHPVFFQGYLEDSLMATKRCMSQDYGFKCHILAVVISVAFDATLGQLRDGWGGGDSWNRYYLAIALLRRDSVWSPTAAPCIIFLSQAPVQWKRKWQLHSKALWTLDGHLVLKKRGPQDHSSGNSNILRLNSKHWDKARHDGVCFSKFDNIFLGHFVEST